MPENDDVRNDKSLTRAQLGVLDLHALWGGLNTPPRPIGLQFKGHESGLTLGHRYKNSEINKVHILVP